MRDLSSRQVMDERPDGDELAAVTTRQFDRRVDDLDIVSRCHLVRVRQSELRHELRASALLRRFDARDFFCVCFFRKKVTTADDYGAAFFTSNAASNGCTVFFASERRCRGFDPVWILAGLQLFGDVARQFSEQRIEQSFEIRHVMSPPS